MVGTPDTGRLPKQTARAPVLFPTNEIHTHEPEIPPGYCWRGSDLILWILGKPGAAEGFGGTCKWSRTQQETFSATLHPQTSWFTGQLKAATQPTSREWGKRNSLVTTKKHVQPSCSPGVYWLLIKMINWKPIGSLAPNFLSYLFWNFFFMPFHKDMRE